jgi:Tfp pilus assembly protein PilX
MLKRLSSILVLAGALDGTVRTIVFDATNLGTATTRFIQGASVAVQGNSLTFLRVRVAGDETKTLVNMGAGEASSHENYTGFFSTPNNAGTITFEITASCQGSTNKGPTVLNGYAVIQFFS